MKSLVEIFINCHFFFNVRTFLEVIWSPHDSETEFHLTFFFRTCSHFTTVLGEFTIVKPKDCLDLVQKVINMVRLFEV